MSLSKNDLGVLGNLAEALGIFRNGSPNADWFPNPDTYLASILANAQQRAALIAFVDEALGGSDRSTQAGVIWLPIVDVPDLPLTVAMTVDESRSDGLHIGIGLKVRSSNPASSSVLSVPLFRARKEGAGSTGPLVLLGSSGGRIKLGTEITLEAGAPVPGQARLGAIALEIDLPTAPADPQPARFGLALLGLQMPGAATPRDVRVAAGSPDALDDALLDLVMSLVKAQADAAGAPAPLVALAGLLGLKAGDHVPDFPIAQLASQGVAAISQWLTGIVQNTNARTDWLGHAARLLNVPPSGDEVRFQLGAASLVLTLEVSTGPSGHTLLAPRLALTLGGAAARLEAAVTPMRVDLQTGSATALPALGLWAGFGTAAAPVLNLPAAAPLPAVRANTLRIGFALDGERRLNFVLAADAVQIGDDSYPTLDLRSPDAVMGVVGNTVGDIATQLLGQLGAALPAVQQLLGLVPPPGAVGLPAVGLPALMADPLAAVAGYWQQLLGQPAAVTAVLQTLRDILADASEAAAVVQGSGTEAAPWRLPLAGPLALEAHAAGPVLTVAVAAATSVGTLGQGCTVVGTRIAATLARIDLAARSAQLMPGVSASLSARERGISPPQVRLGLGGQRQLLADEIALSLAWTPTGGLSAAVRPPNLRFIDQGVTLPLVLPQIASDGNVTLPAEAWDGVQALIGHLALRLAEIRGGTVVAELVQALGWDDLPSQAGGPAAARATLRLAELLQAPQPALKAWLRGLMASELAPRVLALLADLLGGNGAQRPLLLGRGHPDDPYRLPLGEELPEAVLWFVPDGLAPALVAAPLALRQWRPGQAGLGFRLLEASLRAEAEVADDVADLLLGRLPDAATDATSTAPGAIAAGLQALAQRWAGGDGRIAPPALAPAGIDVQTTGLAAGQLWPHLDLPDLIGRSPATVVHVALHAADLPGAPIAADGSGPRVVNLRGAGLEPAMFTLPAAAAGPWYVLLGSRAECRPGGANPSDGTAEQAARLARWLQALADVDSQIAVVAVAGAGHAARLAAEAQAAVTDLVLLGTPLAEIALSALHSQPTADALRLLQTLLPPALPADPADPDSAEDGDLALGRALVGAMAELLPLAEPSAELRPPLLAPPAPRATLAVTAMFGVVTAAQVERAITALLAAGLAARAQARAAAQAAAAAAGLAGPSGVRAGLRWALPARGSGTLRVQGRAELMLLSADLGPSGVVQREKALRVRLALSDRGGWLCATPAASLRAVSVDLHLPLSSLGGATCRITLHEASVFGQRWERLRLGALPGAAAVLPVLPEARLLLSSAVQRLVADVGGASSVALADLLEALGLLAPAGGLAAGALEQLVHDPGGLLQQRLVLAGDELRSALAALLGPLALDIDFAQGRVDLQGGGAAAGRFGWELDAHIGSAGLAGRFAIGPAAALPRVGGVQLVVDLAPFSARLHWHRGAGTAPDTAALWPLPEPQALARMLVHATPALGAQAALELMRRADDSARPLIDGALDALGLLGSAPAGVAGALRPVLPLAGLLRDPRAWLGDPGALAAQPARLQALLDAMRQLMGQPPNPGAPLALGGSAGGVSLAVEADGAGARLALRVDASAWAAPAGAAARLVGGIGASLRLQAGAPPQPALALHLGLPGSSGGRQAVHVALGAGDGPAPALQVFLRPGSGADISLVPFAGLGALAAAAEAALPFLLDRLAAQPGALGSLVGGVGDALGMRSGAPASFDAALLRGWGQQPMEKLRDAAPGIASFGINTLANLLGPVLPAGVSAVADAGALTVNVGVFSLGWNPAEREVRVRAQGLAVPGLHRLSATVAVNASGLRELSFTAGPAQIEAGGVTLQPYVTVAAGTAPAGGRRVLIGLAANENARFALRWLLGDSNGVGNSAGSFSLVASNGTLASAVEVGTPEAVALRLVEVVIDLAAAVAMAQPAVAQLLDTPLPRTGPGTATPRQLLSGVLLDPADTSELIDNLFVPAQMPGRIRQLFVNLSALGLQVELAPLTLAFAEVDGSVGLQVGLAQRFVLIPGDTTLWLENDDSWVTPNPPGDGGLFIGFMPVGGSSFQPKLVVNGLGLRLGRGSGPLIDAGLSIESVALHVYAAIGVGGISGGGVQLQFTNLAVGTGSAGGSNGIAQGVLRDTGPTPPKPMFSPALAVQKHGNSPLSVSLRAGDPPGPWWIAIQKGFGPLYLEQVGFDARTLPGGKLERVSVLMDGSVSMFGLTCTVDDLQVTYFTTDGDFLDAKNWRVDLAGLAVAADMAGVSLAGGLLKQESTNAQGAKQTEYLGMLLGRFAVYGLTVYGGYGEGVDASTNQKFTAFFAIGAVNGPIGGPPAFFLTGIGGGFGINRQLRVPTDLSKFGDYPLIQALDIAASPSDPMTQLRSLASYFPMAKGTFWFAAGLSFNSFALVDGIAVVGVQVGDGLDINLLGLARMALPRPQVAIVSIELGLLVRFSSSEGVLWVQGQLTDNSWLLYPDVKLTGGFAYVIWFKGERAGEFVLTLGGYHPDFSRAGYPVVPRLGLRWSIGDNIVIKAGSYFALTSEALMAGGDFEGSASFGPAWARVTFGAHGIVYFDPFSYQVNAYCRIAAGITVDTWIFGEITISINIGARIDVRGPEFRGSVTFEVGPVELTFEFGGSNRAEFVPISASAFIGKYLEAGDGGAARAHALMTASGAQPSKGEDATPDGSAARPYVVVVEFGLTFTSTVPATRVRRVQPASGSGVTQHDASRALAVGPMGSDTITPEITLTWRRAGTVRSFPFTVKPRPYGAFPLGVWGPAGDANNRKVPKAEMVKALWDPLESTCRHASLSIL